MNTGTAREMAEQKLSCQCRAESALCGRFSSLCPSHFSLRTSPFACNQENLKDSTESELYGYDAVYRLDEFDRGQLNQAKDDANRQAVRWQFGRRQTAVSKGRKPRRGGNWDQTVLDSTTESRTHNDVNELTQRTIGQNPSISLTYDDAGNLTQDGDSDGDHKYTWDYRNRLIEVEEKQSGAWNTVAEYKYDGRTRRILKVVTNKGDLNGTTRFVWGGNSDWQCLEERDGSGNLVARFTYAPGYIDAPARQERDLNSDDDFGDDDEVVWYHSNTLYTVYALSDAGENVVERYRYDAYGACTILDADFSSDADNASDVANGYTWQGRRIQEEVALAYFRMRQQSSALGRFLQRDPLKLLHVLQSSSHMSQVRLPQRFWLSQDPASGGRFVSLMADARHTHRRASANSAPVACHKSLGGGYTSIIALAGNQYLCLGGNPVLFVDPSGLIIDCSCPWGSYGSCDENVFTAECMGGCIVYAADDCGHVSTHQVPCLKQDVGPGGECGKGGMGVIIFALVAMAWRRGEAGPHQPTSSSRRR